MQYTTLNEALDQFKDITNNLTSRSMFGGFGIFADGTMFALVVDDKIHLRAGDDNEKEFKERGLTPYIDTKKASMRVSTRYYAIPNEWWQDKDMINKEAKQALIMAKRDKMKNVKATRIKDLPNMRISTERMLRKAGITTPEALKATGAAIAFKWIQENQQSTLSFDMLWALEGAISGIHARVVSLKRRRELLDSLHEQTDIDDSPTLKKQG